MSFFDYLKKPVKNLFFVFCVWCALSLFASFLQAMAVKSDSAKCETKVYIEYVIFTDLFCEVKK